MKTKQVIGLGMALILVAIITGIAVHNIPNSLAALQPEAIAPTASPTPSATAAFVESTPQTVTLEAVSSNMETPEQIPPCRFEAQTQPTSSSSLDTYVFAEPKVVLTSTTALRLFQWLPDGQTLLIGRGIEGKPEEILQVIDLQTNEFRQYAQAQIVGNSVAWSETQQAVVFVERMLDNRNSLKFSHGIDEPVRELVTDFRSSFSVGNGDCLIFSANDRGGQLQVLRVPNGAATPLLTQLSGYYHTVLSADEMRMAVYNHQHFYLANLPSEQICEIDLGQIGTGEYSKVRASDVAWSADGRYLAMLTNYGNPVQLLNLKIIDILTGEARDVDFGPRSVYSVDWSPNNNIVLVAVQTDPDRSKGNFQSVYLVDATTGDFEHIMPEQNIATLGEHGLLWSPDGNEIGMACPLAEPPDNLIEWRICKASVEVEQP